jgi:iron complex outermembrane recepter protein
MKKVSNAAKSTVKLIAMAALAAQARVPMAASLPPDVLYPKQPLDLSLKQFAVRTQIQLVYLSDLTHGLDAPAVPAGLSAADTLASMLANSGISFRFLNDRTVMLDSTDSIIGQPVTYSRAALNADGDSERIRVVPVNEPSAIEAAASQIGEEVVVTGTRVRDRTRLDTLAPVDVLSVESLSTHGSTELAQAISAAAPSVNFPRPAITDGTDHIRPATLRGLAPDQTLVLVNSKRRHQSALVNVNGAVGRGSAAVDLNAIPLAAIESIEVLRDGASAQYGSDAIAGVINLRLREARDGGKMTVSYGAYDSEVVTERGRRDEHDGQTISASGWTGLHLGADGFLTLSAEYRDRQPTSRGDFDTNVLTLRNPEPLHVTSRYGDSEVRDVTLYANAGLPLGTWDTYGWLGYQARAGESAAFPRLSDNANNVKSIHPYGFLPLIAADIDDIAVGLGMRGTLSGWVSDFSVVYGRNALDYRTENSINGSLGAASPTSFDSGGLEYDQLAANAGFIHEFDWGLAAPANLAVGLEGRRETYSIHAGEPDSYRAGPNPPPGSVPGAQGFPGFQPSNEVDKSRGAFGVYADVEARLTEKLLMSTAMRGEDYSDFGSAVTGKVAGRYDFTPAFALRSTVSTGFRAPGLQQSYFTSTATNFLNGLPVEIGTFPATSPMAQTLGAKPLDAEKSRNYSLGAVMRVADLEATIDAYRIDIDDRIVLSENLNQPNVQALLAPFNIAGARFFINGVDTTTKGVDVVLRYVLHTEQAGKFDFSLIGNQNDTHVTRIPSTSVLAALNPAPALFARSNRVAFENGTPDSKVIAGIGWSLRHADGIWGISTRATRYGEVVEPGLALSGEPVDLRDLNLRPSWVLDLSLAGSFLDNKLSLSIGADNLTDKYPDRTPIERLSPAGGAVNLNPTNALAFSRYSPYGFNGRFVYARAAYNW